MYHGATSEFLHGLLHRKNNIINNICISLLITLIYNPYNIRNISVLLSYGGVIGIIFFQKYINKILDKFIKKKSKIINYIKSIISVSLSVQIIIIPIMVYYYKTISLTFLISNILTGFLISLIIIFGFIIIMISFLSIGLGRLAGSIYNIFIFILLNITKMTAKIPFSKIYIKTPYIYQIFLYYFFIIFFKYFINKEKLKKYIKYKNKIIIIILIIILIPNFIEIFPKNNLDIYFIDVMQGDSTLLVTPQNKKILIDGGGSENYDVRKKYIITIFIK